MDWDDDFDQDEDTTIECPHCGELIFDDVDQCPYCRNYLLSSDFRGSPSTWMIVIIVLVILGLLLPFLSVLF